ncbi:WD40-repeat-containing domain protein [Mucor mucedo]|uniref:WD40-repeat-containing domain protein n=1 Tax=Mucor mucedo TaxID=29922 RepID=UPI00221F1EDC|nr:WD40-repeat-containing domain protein [Mucor mucedo]KAI7891892.1 WD40-repeat-containing domain protein [Mucor mucedo]
MTTRLPFTKIIHNPTKPELVLANGHHFLVLNTSTGELIKTYPQDAKVDPVTDYYRCMSFNKDGTLLATSGENKQICVWDTQDWTVKNTKPAHKRINAVQFTSDSSEIVAADKFGDVYNHSLKDDTPVSEDKQLPILGHVSMVTDMVLSEDDKFVVTSDRDEHIRVSRYPNGYNIECFCLGHTDVVTCVSLLPWNKSILVSAGGDGVVRVWDFLKGSQIQAIDLKEQIEPYKPTAADANSKDAIISSLSFDNKNKLVAVAFAKSPAVLILAWNDDKLSYKQTIVTESPILDIAFDNEGKLWMSHDGQQLVSVYNEAFEKVDTIAEKINNTEVCQADKIFDLYTIFGLRKFLDLPENLVTAYADEAKSKKRKTNA